MSESATTVLPDPRLQCCRIRDYSVAGSATTELPDPRLQSCRIRDYRVAGSATTELPDPRLQSCRIRDYIVAEKTTYRTNIEKKYIYFPLFSSIRFPSYLLFDHSNPLLFFLVLTFYSIMQKPFNFKSICAIIKIYILHS